MRRRATGKRENASIVNPGRWLCLTLMPFMCFSGKSDFKIVRVCAMVVAVRAMRDSGTLGREHYPSFTGMTHGGQGQSATASARARNQHVTKHRQLVQRRLGRKAWSLTRPLRLQVTEQNSILTEILQGSKLRHTEYNDGIDRNLKAKF